MPVSQGPYALFTLEPSAAADTAFSADEKRLYVAMRNGEIHVYDVATHQKIATWQVGSALGALSVSTDGSFLLAVERQPPSGQSVIYRIDTVTGAKTTYSVSGQAYYDVEIVDSDTAVLSGGQSYNLSLLNLTSGAFSALPSSVHYSNTRTTLVEDGRYTLFAEPGISNGPLKLFDDQTNTVVAQGDNYQAGSLSGFNWGSQAVSEEAGLVLQFIYHSTINVFDLNLKPVRTVNIGGTVDGMAFDSSGRHVYVYLIGTGYVAKYDVATWTKVDEYNVGTSSWHNDIGFGSQLTLDSLGRYLTVLDTNAQGGKLRIVDLTGRDESLTGTSGADAIDGGGGNDFFRLQDGGVDAVDGGAGNDSFYFGAAYTAADVIVGGIGRDQVALQGSYALTLGSITGIEDLILLSGTDTRFGDPGTTLYSYDITSLDSNVAAGATLLVDGTQLVAGESFTFDGSAEADGKFILSGGNGVDTLTGGAGADGFYFRGGTFWGPSDKVTGTASDQIGFRGDFTGANKVVMGADQIVGVVTLVLMSGTDTRFGAAVPPTKFDIAMNDGNVAPGLRFTIDGFFLGSDETMRIDGSGEQDGFFRMVGGSGADILIGGAGNDSLRGNVGSDTVTGNNGADTFVYRSAAESTGTGFDLLTDLKSAEDLLDLHSAVTGWNATVGSGQLSQASFDADLAAALDGALDPGKAILFDPNAGTYAGRHFLVVDADGDGAYTAGADYVFELGAAAIVDTGGAGLFV